MKIKVRHQHRSGEIRVMWSPIYDEIHLAYSWTRDYLQQIAGAAKLPALRQIDLKHFGTLLPFVNLVDVERQGGHMRFRYRLIGERQTRFAGRDITGMYLEDAVLPLFVERISRNMLACANGGQILYDAFAMPHPDRDFIRTERVYFPLADDGETVDALLIVNGYPDDAQGDLPDQLPSLPAPSRKDGVLR